MFGKILRGGKLLLLIKVILSVEIWSKPEVINYLIYCNFVSDGNYNFPKSINLAFLINEID